MSEGERVSECIYVYKVVVVTVVAVLLNVPFYQCGLGRELELQQKGLGNR